MLTGLTAKSEQGREAPGEQDSRCRVQTAGEGWGDAHEVLGSTEEARFEG